MKDPGWKVGIQHPSGFVRRCVAITAVGGRRKRTSLFQSIVFHLERGQESDRVARMQQGDRGGQTLQHKKPADRVCYRHYLT